jgi:hypothetical protein
MSTAILHWAAAWLFGAVGLLLVFRALPPNRWFGLRTTRTISDPVAWYSAHRAYGWIFVSAAAAVAALNLLPPSPFNPILGFTGTIAMGAAFLIVYFRYAA